MSYNLIKIIGLTVLMLLTIIQCTNAPADYNQDSKKELITSKEKEDLKKEIIPSKKDTLYKDHEFLFVGNKGEIIKVVRENDSIEIKHKSDTLFSNDYVTFLGDVTNESEIYIKNTPRYRFEDFPADLYNGPLSEPDFSTDKDAKRFKTRITMGSKKPPNLAGHFNFINWGCGSSCQSGIILDAKTGAIYDGLNTSLGFKSKADSRLLMANAGLFEENEKEWIPFCFYCIPEYYLWDENKKVLILLP